MSKTQIERLEGKPKAQAADSLTYEDLLGGVETKVVYRFNHREELYSIEYHFQIERNFLMVALDQFEGIGSILYERYGPPDSGDIGLDRNRKIGRLALEKPLTETWEKDALTHISHTLEQGIVYQHTLTYRHRTLTEEYEDYVKEKEEAKF